MNHTSPTAPDPLDPISTWRAWQALSVYFTVLLNRQLRRRWLLEQISLKDRPTTDRFRPVFFLEQVPPLHKPVLTPQLPCTEKYNPFNEDTLDALREQVHLLRARVEKGKELAAEIERRMQDPRIQFPTHFCHTCIAGGDTSEVLLTKCGHRVCRTCLSFGCGVDGAYECSICFAPTSFVARSPLSGARSCSEQISSVSMRVLKGRGGGGKALMGALVKPS